MARRKDVQVRLTGRTDFFTSQTKHYFAAQCHQSELMRRPEVFIGSDKGHFPAYAAGSVCGDNTERRVVLPDKTGHRIERRVGLRQRNALERKPREPDRGGGSRRPKIDLDEIKKFWGL